MTAPRPAVNSTRLHQTTSMSISLPPPPSLLSTSPSGASPGASGSRPMRSPPLSPGGRGGGSGFLGGFMRRPRAATGDSSSRPPAFANHPHPHQPPSESVPPVSSGMQASSPPTNHRPYPASAESLLALNSPSASPNPQTSPPTNRRRTTTGSSMGGGLGGQVGSGGGRASPGTGSPGAGAREDPLAAFGRGLLKRMGGSQGSPSSGAGSGGATGSGGSGSRLASSPSAAGGGGVAHVESAGTAPSHLSARTPIGSQLIAAPTSPSPAVATSSAHSPLGAVSSDIPAAPAPTHRLRLVPFLTASSGAAFDLIERDVKESPNPLGGGVEALKIGRFTDKAALVVPSGERRGGALDSNKVAFKSKVVSRCHAEIWVVAGGQFFVKDTKSSSGTFLNQSRLSAPSIESKPFAIKDGDVLQLGVDYQGGAEEIYRSIKMRVEINRQWQNGANKFNTNAMKQLNALGGDGKSSSVGGASGSSGAGAKARKSVTDCCICLFSVTICQSLFIAPCSHVYHYKCIRPLLEMHHPGFQCPICRSFADLEADVETDDAQFDTASRHSRRESMISRKGSLISVAAAFEQGLGEALAAAEADAEANSSRMDVDLDLDDDDEAFDGYPASPARPAFGTRTTAGDLHHASNRPDTATRPETAVDPLAPQPGSASLFRQPFGGSPTPTPTPAAGGADGDHSGAANAGYQHSHISHPISQDSSIVSPGASDVGREGFQEQDEVVTEARAFAEEVVRRAGEEEEAEGTRTPNGGQASHGL